MRRPPGQREGDAGHAAGNDQRQALPGGCGRAASGDREGAALEAMAFGTVATGSRRFMPDVVERRVTPGHLWLRTLAGVRW